MTGVGALFAQMWLLCLAAFLLGALATWLLVARPARREAARAREAAARRDEPVDPVRAAQAPPTPIPGVPRHARPSGGDPALPALGRRRRSGSSALGAPARLRHGTPEGPPRGGDAGPVVPRQPGPGPRGGGADGPLVPPQDRGHALFTPPEPRAPEPDEPPDLPPGREPPDDPR
ncbi:hypothetical protein LWC35_06930 [Pseudonocardia kujensis]|uniref:hypothetical protein n=1 Tax=Pseudonocardia kujensis TaxID=1128675 RepID=UPI001E65A3B4|nr:hypothetical protein [Pseudonocardia kujensis]MCE0762642.1 hypothetical protein [Pseudonocardia kujensis]